MIRVLLVDDSPIALHIMQRLLSNSPGIQVAGTAANGKEALELLPELNPDVICTDLHMPVMDGLEFTRAVMNKYPRPILVVSVSVEPDSSNIFQMLGAGAVDVYPKPRDILGADQDKLARELASKIRILAGVHVFRRIWRKCRSTPMSPKRTLAEWRRTRMWISRSTRSRIAHFTGQVVQVRNSPITVQNVVTYDTVIGVNNPDLKLKPGMTANVSVIVAEHNDVLRIPNSALRFRPRNASTNSTPRVAGGAWRRTALASRWFHRRAPQRGTSIPHERFTFLRTHKLQPVQVKTGITDGIYTEIMDGLSENDKVVTSASYKQGSAAAQPPIRSAACGGSEEVRSSWRRS